MRVVTFLAQLGYHDETPDSIAATCKGNLKRVWDFLLDRARPKTEKQRVDRAVREWQQQQEIDTANASRAAQAVVLRAQLVALRRECDGMERTLAQQQEELRLQARSVVEGSGEGLLADQEQRDAELVVSKRGRRGGAEAEGREKRFETAKTSRSSIRLPTCTHPQNPLFRPGTGPRLLLPTLHAPSAAARRAPAVPPISRHSGARAPAAAAAAAAEPLWQRGARGGGRRLGCDGPAPG